MLFCSYNNNFKDSESKLGSYRIQYWSKYIGNIKKSMFLEVLHVCPKLERTAVIPCTGRVVKISALQMGVNWGGRGGGEIMKKMSDGGTVLL